MRIIIPKKPLHFYANLMKKKVVAFGPEYEFNKWQLLLWHLAVFLVMWIILHLSQREPLKNKFSPVSLLESVCLYSCFPTQFEWQMHYWFTDTRHFGTDFISLFTVASWKHTNKFGIFLQQLYRISLTRNL